MARERLVVGREAIDNCEDIKNLAPSDLEDYVLLTPIKSVSYDKTKNTVTELILEKIEMDDDTFE